jgi:hypothetical protein
MGINRLRRRNTPKRQPPPTIGVTRSTGTTGSSGPITPSQSASQRGNSSLEVGGKSPGIDINLSTIQSSSFDIGDIIEIKKRVKEVFSSHPMTKEIKRISVIKKGANQSTVRICTRTQDDARMAGIHKEWINTNFQEAHILQKQ